MSSKRLDRQTLTAFLVVVMTLWLGACGGVKVKRYQAGSPDAEAYEKAVSPPVFQKVPAAENPGLIQAAPVAGAAGAKSYLIEVEDELDISVYGETDLQHVVVPVRPDGMISFAFIGDVMAAGRSVEEVRAEVTQRLGQYLRSPQVTVIAKQFAQKKVYIGGEVKTPGILYLTGKEGTLLDALYKAGLATEKADLEGAYLIRENKVVDADFKDLVLGDISRNLKLADQDLIYIPENTRRFVYVIGEVNQNDAIPFSEPVPIIRVIAEAGGLREYAKRGEIAVIRGGLKEPEMAIVNARHLLKGDLSQNILVQPGDIVYVAKSALGHYAAFMDQLYRGISLITQRNLLVESLNRNRSTVRVVNSDPNN
ncbi:MAG TPA: polysaccharide biosynthesis/export family protein [Candidatus Polarisedimenticolia bacterium]|jgi:polysaccharide export outer membrane protein